jgi:hypothetical protein
MAAIEMNLALKSQRKKCGGLWLLRFRFSL